MTLWDDIRQIKSGDKELRSFGRVVGGVFLILGGFLVWRGRSHGIYFATPGAVLVVLGAAFPRILKPVQKVWMALALILGFFMTKILLSALFYFVFTPIGLILRCSGKDLMNRSWDKKAPTYWIRRTGFVEPSRYENQY